MDRYRCPPDAHLRAMLDAALPPDARGVEAHVDGCRECQRRLEELTAGPLADRLRAASPAAGDHPSLLATTFLNRIRGQGPVERPTDTPAAWPTLPGYRILGELGRGAIGVVYQAHDLRLNRTVAVKMLLNEAFVRAETRMRFLIEAEAVARLRHRGIVQVFEFGDANGSPFLAMEFVPGGTLARRLDDGPRLDPRSAAALLLELAVAVAAAHRAGVIHRDLKPANILTDDRPDDAGTGGGSDDATHTDPRLGFRTKITDFGLARIDGAEATVVTVTGTVMGTPAYMAPEQASGDVRRVDTRADVYALGAILYELLTGQPPFTGSSAMDVLHQVIHVEPRAPRSLAGGVPRDLDVICRKCLAKEPARRYGTADALADDLRAYLTGRPITARPVATWERVARFARRNPWPTAALFAFLFGAAASFILVNAARVGEMAATKTANERARVAQDARAAEAEARALAERREALIAFDRAVLRCASGDIDGGVGDLEAAVGKADQAGDGDLARVARVNLRVWRGRLPVLVRRYPAAGSGATTAVEFADGGDLVVLADGKSGVLRAWPTPPASADRPAYELRPDRTVLRTPVPVGLVPAPGGGLYVGYRSGTVRRFDSRTGRPDGPAFELPFLTELSDFAVHPRGKWLALASSAGTVRVVAAETGKLVLPDLTHRTPVGKADPPEFDPKSRANSPSAVAFADDGLFVLAAARNGGVLMWGLPTGVCLHHFDFGTEVFRLAVGGGGQYFLAGGETATSLWSIHNRSRPLWIHNHPQRAGAVAFSPDGRVCVTADHAGNVACLNRETGRLIARFRHSDAVRAVAFHPVDPLLLLVAGDDGVVDLWRLPPREDQTLAVPTATTAAPWDTVPIGTTSHRTVSAVGFWPGSADVWSASPGALKRWAGVEPPYSAVENKLDYKRAGRGIRAAEVSADGRLAVSGGWSDSYTGVWDLSGATPAYHPLGVEAAAVGILPDGRSFFTVTEEATGGGLRWWTWRDGKPVPDRPGWPALSYPLVLAPHPDGQTVLVGQKLGEPTGLRDATTGRLVLELAHPVTVTAVAVHPAGTFAATGGRDGSVRVWSLPDGKPVGRPFFHADRVNQLVFGTGAADGALLTVSHDRTGRVWDFRLGLPLGPPLEHPEAVLTAALAPDGRLITGGKDGVVRLWRTDWLCRPPAGDR